jgi:hypothetical protein
LAAFPLLLGKEELHMAVSNRQKKILRFFGVPISPSMSPGAAGWEIGAILADEANRELWKRYLYVTQDFGSDSDELLPFDRDTLESVEIPEGWSGQAAIAEFREGVVEDMLSDGSPYDRPQPEVVFRGSTFVFTGKFVFGSREQCQEAVVARGGIAQTTSGVSQHTDFLVIGAEGSKTWKRGKYGRKIEAAVLSRREHGKPAIISEDHWTESMEATQQGCSS